MPTKPTVAGHRISPKDLTAEQRAAYDKLKARAAEEGADYAHKPGISELLTPEELADGAPFYFALQACVMQLKKAREAAGLTLSQVAEKTGLATETLCRLETGQVTNPTWKTLGLYAAAVGRKLSMSAEV